jgi:hypothetical protein
VKTTTPGGLLPGRGAEVEALFKEARRRQRRRYLLTGLAVVVLAAVGIMVSQSGEGRQPGGRPGTRHPAGPPVSVPSFTPAAMPAFFVDVLATGEGNGGLQVRASGRGNLVAELPSHGIAGGAVEALAATGPGSFVVAEPVDDGSGTRLYRFQLNSKGHPGTLIRVGPVLHNWVDSLAASAGGQVIGYTLGLDGIRYIGVFNTRTGRSREWGFPKTEEFSPNGALSMSADGRLLAFTAFDMSGKPGRHVIQVLPTDAPAGTVAQRSHVVLSRPLPFSSQSSLAEVALSPDAASFYL